MPPIQTLPSSDIVPTPLLPPAADVFARRAARLRILAAGHALAAWLEWLAKLADAQQRVLDELSAEPSVPAADGAAVLPRLLAALDELPPGIASAATLTAEELAHRLARNLDHSRGLAAGAARDGVDLLVGAALQVAATAQALTATVPENAANAAACPRCGGAAQGSIVLAGAGKSGLRYQECCLCGTRWNRVRAHCTLCEDGARVDYLSLDSDKAAVGAETCDACHGYAKIYFQSRDPDVEPLVDDLATLALDVLVGEAGYGRGAPNLFLCEGEAI
jgi:FdhE protein